MREILFRGQTRKKGEKVRLDGSPIDSNWVYGGIFPNNKGGDFAIIYQQEPTIEKFTVYADTVGQYTGLTDKNGTRIFEGDIIRYENEKFVVKYIDNFATFDLRSPCNMARYKPPLQLSMSEKFYTVIGNIHDNPELLK